MVHLLDLRVDSFVDVRRRSSILFTAILSSAARYHSSTFFLNSLSTTEISSPDLQKATQQLPYD